MKATELLEAANDKQKWVKSILKKMKISTKDVKILEDGSVIFNKIFSPSTNYVFREIPFKIKEAHGNVFLSGHGLQTLDNLPKEVGGNLDISSNTGLKSLEGCPEKIKGYFKMSITGVDTLKHFPKYVGGDVNVSRCERLRPYEMRYALFSNVVGNFLTDWNEVTDEMSEYFAFPERKREDKIIEMIEFLEGFK